MTCDYNEETIAEAMRTFADAPLSGVERADLSAWTARVHSMAAVAARVTAVLTASKRSAR